MTCAHCRDAGDFFAARVARRELRRYRRRGPSEPTRRLLDAVEERLPEQGFTVLDVGGGIGAIQHEMLRRGAARVVNVDASAAYHGAALSEARRNGTADRLELHLGDFVELAGEIGPVDLVTLDRVVCCYPDLPALVDASAARARRLYGLVFPREHVLFRFGVGAVNLWMALQRSAFRVYLHGTGHIVEAAERQGLRSVWQGRTVLWQMHLFERESAPAVRAPDPGRSPPGPPGPPGR